MRHRVELGLRLTPTSLALLALGGTPLGCAGVPPILQVLAGVGPAARGMGLPGLAVRGDPRQLAILVGRGAPVAVAHDLVRQIPAQLSLRKQPRGRILDEPESRLELLQELKAATHDGQRRLQLPRTRRQRPAEFGAGW